MYRQKKLKIKYKKGLVPRGNDGPPCRVCTEAQTGSKVPSSCEMKGLGCSHAPLESASPIVQVQSFGRERERDNTTGVVSAHVLRGYTKTRRRNSNLCSWKKKNIYIRKKKSLQSLSGTWEPFRWCRKYDTAGVESTTANCPMWRRKASFSVKRVFRVRGAASESQQGSGPATQGDATGPRI